MAVPKLGGLEKLDVTPGGGVRAGPLRIACTLAAVDCDAIAHNRDV